MADTSAGRKRDWPQLGPLSVHPVVMARVRRDIRASGLSQAAWHRRVIAKAVGLVQKQKEAAG